MPRYLISGLCLQGNKGGPALALSLIKNIKDQIPDAEFVLAVPGNETEWPHEQEWAKIFGIQIIKSLSLSKGQIPRFYNCWRELRRCDALIQMSAICYLGPPAGSGSWISTIASLRWLDFCLSKIARRPLFAWTQSYGPFTSPAVRRLGRFDLSRQKIIFCRGEDCLAEVKALLPECIAFNFPDVAISLPYDKCWGSNYIKENFSFEGSLVTMSPSSVMYSKCTGNKAQNEHVLQQVEIAKTLIERGNKVLLVPHTFRPSNQNPRHCDLVICRLVHDLMSRPEVRLLDKDLSPNQLKSVIANASFHVGARYHSLVAALSSHVPAISISWHPKYRDLMRSYGLEEYILEGADTQNIMKFVDQLSSQNMELRALLKQRQSCLFQQVEENSMKFAGLLTD